MEFMLKVLGSFIFWAVYLPIGFVIGCIMLRKYAKRAWKYFTTGEKYWATTPFDSWMFFIFWVGVSLLLWPVVLSIFAFCLLLKHVIGVGLKHAIVWAGTCIPDFTLQKKED